MRVLISTGPSYGLFFPLVPLAWALRAAGHEVVCASPEGHARTVASAGLNFAPTYGPMTMREVMLADRAGRPVTIADTEPELLEQVGRGFGRLAARTLPGVDDVVRRLRPDVVVAEPHAYSAAVSAATHGIPYVRHGIGMGFDPVIDRWGADELAPELTARGLADIPGPALDLDPCPAPVRAPHAEHLPPIRYIPFEAPTTLPAWLTTPRDRPRVLLTLGTVAPQGRGLPLFRELLAALPALGVELVVAVEDKALSALEPLPDAVVAAGWLPLATAVGVCDVIVHHGGGGTTMAGIRAGVPQLLLPQVLPEQYDSARRLADHGSALQLPGGNFSSSDIVDAAGRLLGEPEFTVRARALAAAVAEMPSPVEVLPYIESLTKADMSAS
ncbi:nucleotide disphospho-sugar-binding domain-containing protein [Nocardia alba]|uniref:Glycosyltransferase n=1 Tax=Nocardia alba TaxID=225051 RepID=A0A4R1F6F6_9NOCA|nr:nucleotide disphospho-sugar-binding domain-containing protein [Nocardia alba]TCJ89896.1 glycosyltransferase [Nocardia alba]